MDANLEGPLKALAQALHLAIARSEDVDEALEEVRAEGYNPMLVLEITLNLVQLDEDDLPAVEALLTSGEAADDALPAIDLGTDASGEDPPQVSSDDHEFLRSLRIRLD